MLRVTPSVSIQLMQCRYSASLTVRGRSAYRRLAVAVIAASTDCFSPHRPCGVHPANPYRSQNGLPSKGSQCGMSWKSWAILASTWSR